MLRGAVGLIPLNEILCTRARARTHTHRDVGVDPAAMEETEDILLANRDIGLSVQLLRQLPRECVSVCEREWLQVRV